MVSSHMLPGRVGRLCRRAWARSVGERRFVSVWLSVWRALRTCVGNKASCKAAIAERPSAGNGQKSGKRLCTCRQASSATLWGAVQGGRRELAVERAVATRAAEESFSSVLW
jgi:hypothetical protein